MRDRLLAHGWLTNKPEPFRQAVLDLAMPRSYVAGQFTHHIGDALGGFYGVVSGSFAALGKSATSDVPMGHVFRRGGWFGEGPLVTGRPRTLAFRAMEPSQVAYVPLTAVETIARSMPDALRHFASLSEHNLDVSVQTVADLLIRRADQRIAAVLLRVTGAEFDRFYPGGPERCALTQSDIAEMSNVSRQVANTTLGFLQREGWIEIGYGWIRIRNAERLRAFVETEIEGRKSR